MQTFAEFVATSFESTVELYWDYSRRGVATARFGVRDIAVTVTFEQPEPSAAWRISFDVDRSENLTSVAYGAFEIFNGVVDALEEFLIVREPDVAVIVSKTEQLTRIYETYLKREAGRLGRIGYVLADPVRADPYTEFTLRRVRKPNWNS